MRPVRYRILWALPLVACLYAGVFARLFAGWIDDYTFSYGIFVPFFALFVLWRERNKLRAIEPAPSWVGAPLVAFGLLMLMLGVHGRNLYLSSVSLLVVLAGLVVLLQGLPFFHAVLFPWAFLILMIPIPGVIVQYITQPLQWLASAVASSLLGLAGVPVLREGNIIQLSNMALYVHEEDSGIRSLFSLVTLSLMYGYLAEKRNWVRFLLTCSAVPIAVATNSLRIAGAGLLAYWAPEHGFHLFSGLLIFLVSLILLFALHRLICLLGKTRPEARINTPA
jgi:exosortase